MGVGVWGQGEGKIGKNGFAQGGEVGSKYTIFT